MLVITLGLVQQHPEAAMWAQAVPGILSQLTQQSAKHGTTWRAARCARNSAPCKRTNNLSRPFVKASSYPSSATSELVKLTSMVELLAETLFT